MKAHLRDAALCLSLANLLWLAPWQVALNQENLFYFETGVPPLYFLSPLIGILGTVVMLWVALIAIRSSRRLRSAGTAGFVVLCLLAANTVRNEIPSLSLDHLSGVYGTVRLAAIVFLTFVTIVWVFVFRRDAMVDVLRVGVLMLTPLFLVMLTQGIQAAVSEEQLAVGPQSRLLPRSSAGPRVVVIVFDGMDRETALGTAEGPTRLPSFSRLQGEAVHFDLAEPPSGPRTLTSLPSITLGRVVMDSKPTGRGDLMVQYSNGEKGLWSQPPNLFRIVRAEGIDTFLAGWYIPYCRIFAQDLSNCSWRPYIPRPDTLLSAFQRDASLLWKSVPGGYRLFPWRAWPDNIRADSAMVTWHLQSYLAVHERALEGVGNRAFRLVFLHYPVPHEPVVFDKERGELSSAKGGEYVANQILADRAFGLLRAAMEESFTWDESAVIVLGDHGPRHRKDTRHPLLIVKPPYSKREVAVDRKVNLVGVFDVILGLLKGQIRSPDEVASAVVGSQGKIPSGPS